MRVFDVEQQQFSGDGFQETNVFVVASTWWQAKKEAQEDFPDAHDVRVIENWSAHVERDHTGAFVVRTTADQ